MKIHLVEGKPSQSEPPRIEAHAMLATANMEAASMVNAMRTGHGLPATASAETWQDSLAEMNADIAGTATVKIGETELKGLAMRDWRISDGQHDGITFLPWPMEIEANLPEALHIRVWHPDNLRKPAGKERQIWIEIDDTAVVVRCYDTKHDEPVNVRIQRDSITVDSDRLKTAVSTED
ncbi:hypothetical protein [Mesorhizobium silamurunense]|uniref:hypothetical protein n=1 Tax=Mesorhizobium silamurunense TaxID=499528 RepID=UPI0017869713|nr:hypothetical protein [Mesorhizobium silamurunense]